MPFGDRTGPRGEGPFTGRLRRGNYWVVGEDGGPDDDEVKGPLGLWHFPLLNGLRNRE